MNPSMDFQPELIFVAAPPTAQCSSLQEEFTAVWGSIAPWESDAAISNDISQRL